MGESATPAQTPSAAPSRIHPNGGPTVAVPIPAEFVDLIAERAAALVADRQAPADDGYLDVAGAAAFLACSTSRVYSLVSARRIPFEKDGSRVLFERSELRDWVRKGGAKCP